MRWLLIVLFFALSPRLYAQVDCISATPLTNACFPITYQLFSCHFDSAVSTWYIDGQTQVGDSAFIVVEDTSLYEVMMVSLFPDGTTDTAYKSFHIQMPVADFSLSPTVGCSPLISYYVNTSTNAIAYERRLFNETDTIVFSPWTLPWPWPPQIAITTPSCWSMMLIAKTYAGCRDTMIIPNICAYGVMPEFNYTPANGCAPLTVNFYDSTQATQFGTPAGWHWDFGDGDTSNLQNPTHAYAQAGLYDVTLCVSTNDSAFACENCKTVTKAVTAGAQFYPVQNNPDLAIGDEVTYVAPPVDFATSSWSITPSAGVTLLTSSNNDSAFVQFNQADTFELCYSIVAQNCTSQKCTTLAVSDTTNAVQQLSGEFNFELSPNPTAGNFALSIESPRQCYATIDVIGINGGLATTFNRKLSAGKNSIQLDVSELPDGIYLVRMVTPRGGGYNKLAVQR